MKSGDAIIAMSANSIAGVVVRTTVLIVVALALAVPPPAWSQINLGEEGKAQIYGDFRLRMESDWDSQRSNATLRSDRDRMRIRLRLGLNWNPTEFLSAGLRVRSGNQDSSQSPHITFVDFDDNSTGAQDVLLDKYFLQGKAAGFSLWGGRNSLPFWKQNELFWDDDVTIAGVGARYQVDVGNGSLTLNAGSAALPDGGVRFNGLLNTGQLVYAGSGGAVGYTAAFGVARMEGTNRNLLLRHGNGRRDYTILLGDLQLKADVGERPLTLGFDVMHNAEDYKGATDAFTAANADEKDGFLGSVHWGPTSQKFDWQVGYYYAYIETLAVNASYAQDDWMRWGTATETDASDFKGHEFRFTFVPLSKANAVARFYVVEAITSVQDGKRFRIDFNYKF